MNLVVIREILRTLLPLIMVFAGVLEYISGTEAGVIAGAILIAGGIIAIAAEGR